MRVVSAADPEAMDAAARALEAGEAVVVPTETVPGLVALAARAAAVDRLFVLKGRPADIALAVLVADVAQAASLAVLGDGARRLADRFWPGPLTLVLPRLPGVTLALGGDPGTIGVRCPDHPFVRSLVARVGPVAATSANRHGETTAASAVAAAASLDGFVGLVVEGGPCTGVPSTVVDLTGAAPRIIRAGPVTDADLAAAVGTD